MFQKMKEKKKKKQEIRIKFDKLLKGDATCIPFDISIALFPSSVNKNDYYILLNNNPIKTTSNSFSEILYHIGEHIKEVYT